MGTKYSSNTISGYNSVPPADDGTVSEANKVKWDTVKTKLSDPVKTLAETINSELATHFDTGPTALATNTTLTASHYNQFIQASGSGVTLTLTDASTLAAGWYCDIFNTDSANTVTLGRATASNTINSTTANASILPYQVVRAAVNAAANGFLVDIKNSHSKQQRLGHSIWMAEGADVASASDCDIWAGKDGNTVHITGTTTITDWGTAPQAGAWMWVIFDGALQLTYNATTNKLNTNAANYTTVAGDRALVYAETTSSYVVTIFPLNGQALTLQNIAGSPQIMGTKFLGITNFTQNSTLYIGEMGSSAPATETDMNWYPCIPVRVRDLIFRANAAPPAGQTFTATLRKNGADTTLTAQITSSDTVVSDTTNVVTAGPGDLLAWKIVSSATTGSTIDLVLSFRVTDLNTTNGVSCIPFNYNNVGAGTVTAFAGINASANGGVEINYWLPIAKSGVYLSRLHTEAASGVILTAVQTNNVTKAYLEPAGQSVAYSGATGVAKQIIDAIPMDSSSYLLLFNSGVGSAVRQRGSFSLSYKDTNWQMPYMPLWFSSNNQAQGTTRYMAGPSFSGTATESEVQVPLMAGTLKNFILINTSTGVAGQTWTAVVRKNGADQVTVIISGTSTVQVDLSSTITVVNEDLISVSLTSSASTGSRTMHFGMEHLV